jgi:glycosyltransferase involved in cell wall biosynthesis
MLQGGSENAPSVSVIIPCYNGEQFVAFAIESALAQTYPNVEIIVVDDGSTDGSRAAVARYREDPRVRFLEHDSNKGIAAARNTGIRASTGELIGFLDQDDIWLPEKLALQVPRFSCDGSDDLGLVLSDTLTADKDGRPCGAPSRLPVPADLNDLSREDAFRKLFAGNFITTASVLVRRECFDTLGLLDESIRGGADDYEFWLRLAGRCRIEHLDECVAVRRVHSGNYSANTERLISDTLVFSRRVVAEHPYLSDMLEPKLAYLHSRLGSYYRSTGRYRQAISSFRTAQSHGRLGPWATAAFLLCFLGPIAGWITRRKRTPAARRPGSQRGE